MDFGKILDAEKLEKINWSLPPLNDEFELAQLARLRRAGARSSSPQIVRVGVPVWSHDPWVGNFYKPGTKTPDYLKEYATQLSTVEVNSTFYAIPSRDTFQKWVDAVPENFRFCPKFPQAASWAMGADENDAELVDFSDRINLLGSKLGACFLQLPPSFTASARKRLEAFLEQLPRSLRILIELRHPSFFENRRLAPEWLELFASHHIGTVITDTPEHRNLAHASLSNVRVMVRFLGANLHPSDWVRLDQWVERITVWMQNGMREVFFMVHEPDNTFSPQAAQYLIHRLNESFREHHLDIKIPELKMHTPEQGTLL